MNIHYRIWDFIFMVYYGIYCVMFLYIWHEALHGVFGCLYPGPCKLTE